LLVSVTVEPAVAVTVQLPWRSKPTVESQFVNFKEPVVLRTVPVTVVYRDAGVLNPAGAAMVRFVVWVVALEFCAVNVVVAPLDPAEIVTCVGLTLPADALELFTVIFTGDTPPAKASVATKFPDESNCAGYT
jgi:hypothetical protein